MRKAKKSIHVEVVALSLFIGVLAVYAVFSTVVGSDVDAAGPADGVCVAHKAKCDAMTKPEQAKEKEDCLKKIQPGKKEIGCKDSVCQGFCELGGGGALCRGDGGNTGSCPKASDDGAKKAKEAADKAAKDLGDKAKKEEPKGGGEPPKMPEMPKKEPKQDQPKDPNACDNGKPRGVDGKCPSDNPPPSFESFWEGMKNSLPESLRKALSLDEPDKLTPDEQLRQIAEQVDTTPDLSAPQKEALKDYIAAARDVGNTQPIETLISENKNRTPESLEEGTSELQRYAESAGGQNPLIETGSINPESSGNIITAIGNSLKSLLKSVWPF